MNKREISQALDAAEAADPTGPVVITDEGSPAYVLLGYDHYLRLFNGASGLSGVAAGDAGSIPEPGEVEHGVPSRFGVSDAEGFWTERSLEELAAAQGVQAVESVENLQDGTISDQEAEAFITALGL